MVVVRREGESQDSAKAVALLQFDHDVGERDGAAAQADALDALVVAEHLWGDRPFVADLAELELHLADATAPSLAAHPVSQSGPGQRPEQGLVVGSVDLDAVGEDRHSHTQCTPIDPRPSNSAVTTPSASSRTDAVSPPDSTTEPGSIPSPRCASASASQTRAAAGCPITAPPAAVSIPPRPRKTQPRTARSTRSAGRRACVPSTTRAAPALSAMESGSWNGAEYRESTTSTAARTASVAANTPAIVVGASIRSRTRKAISGSARGRISSPRCTGSPCGSSIPEVRRPNTGSWMLSALRLTALVSPSFAPITCSPVCRRCSTNNACAAYAVRTSKKGSFRVKGATGFRSCSAVIRASAMARGLVMNAPR